MSARTADAEPAADVRDRGVVVEMWSDLGCPWCYLAKHRLQAALATRPDADPITLRLRSFELDPAACGDPVGIMEVFARKHGADADIAARMERRMQAMAAAENLPFALDRLHDNSFDVHRLAKLADEQGRGWAFFSLIQYRYFAGDLNPFDRDELIGAADDAGLGVDQVRTVLDGDRYAADVRRDEAEARDLGVTGVPFVVFDGRFAASGAQPIEVYGQALDRITA